MNPIQIATILVVVVQICLAVLVAVVLLNARIIHRLARDLRTHTDARWTEIERRLRG
jgi:hypothetical protein